jgi:DNA-binding NarL/FixJ family response regulator
MIRVFLADDHPVVRQGLRDMLEEEGGFQIVGEADDGRQALDQLEKLEWDVLVLDLSLPKVSGTEVLRRITKQRPDARVLVLSMYAAQQYAARAIEAGATGYLSKSHTPEELLKAINDVARGRRYAPPELMGEKATKAQRSLEPHELLSAREYQLLMLFLQGRSNADISAELNIGPSTVSTHFGRIKTKLGVKTVAEVVTYAVQLGLVDEPG